MWEESPECTLNTVSFINALDQYSPFRMANAQVLLVSVCLQYFPAMDLNEEWWSWGFLPAAGYQLCWLYETGIWCLSDPSSSNSFPQKKSGKTYKEIYWVEHNQQQKQTSTHHTHKTETNALINRGEKRCRIKIPSIRSMSVCSPGVLCYF